MQGSLSSNKGRKGLHGAYTGPLFSEWLRGRLISDSVGVLLIGLFRALIRFGNRLMPSGIAILSLFVAPG